MESLGYISDLLIRCKVTEDTYLETYTIAPPAPSQRYLMNFIFCDLKTLIDTFIVGRS
jgi:hypothetical protein